MGYHIILESMLRYSVETNKPFVTAGLASPWLFVSFYCLQILNSFVRLFASRKIFVRLFASCMLLPTFPEEPEAGTKWSNYATIKAMAVELDDQQGAWRAAPTDPL